MARPKPKPPPPAATPTKGLHCPSCGHLPVSHRYGPCEYVEREGWDGLKKNFAKETPCTCPGWK